MNWLDKLERRFGFIALPNAIALVIAGQALATLLAYQQPGLEAQMVLDPAAVAHGELWRLVSFIFVPQNPNATPMGILFTLMWFYFLWFMGRALEQAWGAFKLTVYLMAGLIFQASVSMLAWYSLGWPILQGGYYWTLSIHLAFAYLYPEFTIYIFMILPVKMRWWAWFIGALLVFDVVSGGLSAFFVVSTALGNYLLFFGGDYIQNYRMRHQTAQTRNHMQASISKAMATAPSKRCSDCGLGSDAADLRLCTCQRCGEDGKFWCTEHLPAHLGNS